MECFVFIGWPKNAENTGIERMGVKVDGQKVDGQKVVEVGIL